MVLVAGAPVSFQLKLEKAGLVPDISDNSIFLGCVARRSKTANSHWRLINMKHISTIIDDLDLNDHLADEHAIDYFEAMHDRLHDEYHQLQEQAVVKEVRNG